MSVPFLGTFVLITSTLSGCLTSHDERIIYVTRAEFAVYWVELEQRWPLFFAGQCVTPPKLPPEKDVFNMVTFLEVVAGSRFPTCTYRLSSNEIRIGSDKWGSGCVAHEIGHAACDLLGIGICRDFEHPEYRSKC